MFKIGSFTGLLKRLAGLFITALALQTFITIPGRTGVVAVITPSFAHTFYDIFGNFLLVSAYALYIGVIILVPVVIVIYIYNKIKSKGKPNKEVSYTVSERGLSDVVKKVQEMGHIKKMVDKSLSDIKEEDNGKPDSTL